MNLAFLSVGPKFPTLHSTLELIFFKWGHKRFWAGLWHFVVAKLSVLSGSPEVSSFLSRKPSVSPPSAFRPSYLGTFGPPAGYILTIAKLSTLHFHDATLKLSEIRASGKPQIIWKCCVVNDVSEYLNCSSVTSWLKSQGLFWHGQDLLGFYTIQKTENWLGWFDPSRFWLPSWLP